MLPADVGCIVDNCDTVCAVYDAVVFGKPLIARVVTVSGDGIACPGNFECRIGTDVNVLLEAAGGLKEGAEKIIAGGPMMGFAMYDLDVPTTKTTSAVTCLLHDHVKDSPVTACINCGRCVKACSEGLVPARLSQFAEKTDLESFEKWHGMECVECGCCSYVCPAKRPLAQVIRNARRMAMAERKKQGGK